MLRSGKKKEIPIIPDRLHEKCGHHRSRPTSGATNYLIRSTFDRKGVASRLSEVKETDEKKPSEKLKDLYAEIHLILSKKWSNKSLKMFEGHIKEIYSIEEIDFKATTTPKVENPHEALSVLAMLDKFCQSMVTNHLLIKELR